jgi:eukaryotic-like serine/threonine-protein kinase
MEFGIREDFEMADRDGQRLGNYRLIRPIGQGAFARVYLGEHVYLQTQAAIKVLQLQLASNAMEKFLAEARTIARLRHPSIVGLLEFGVDSNIPFLVMEYAPNGSLRQRHPKGTRVPLRDILSYVKQIAAGLQYAHDEKLIHRDIKPANLLIGAENEVLLADFGIALIAQTYYQKTLEVAGTPAYMAPEQLRGKPRQASDQYALGIVVYEWLSGSCPFHGSFAEIASQHLYAPPPPLHTKVPSISPDVEQVIMTALAKEPEQRFVNVEALARALEQACELAPSPLVLQASNPPTSLPLSPMQPEAAAPPLSRYPSPQPTNTPSLEQAAVPTQQRGKRFSLRITILLSILALLIIAASGFYAIASRSTSLHPRAISTVTAKVSSTTQLYLTATSGNISLNDPLSQNDINNWVEYFPPQGGGCAFREGAYYSTALQKGILPCLAQGPDFSDFTYQVQMTISTGDEGGLIFRSDDLNPNGDPSSTNYYLFGIRNDGHYSLSYHSNQPGVLLTSGSSSAIKTGLNQPNLLTVIARGSNISLYVNQRYITSVNDSTRSSGLIGVFAQNDGNSTELAFRNAQVWTS